MVYSMLIDLKRCVGCQACVTRCKSANATPPNVLRSRVDRIVEGTYPDTVKQIIPMLCMQCENPPCVEICPQKATYKREEDGVVVVDKEKCIGCESCTTVCPYGARYLIDLSSGYFGAKFTEYEEIAYQRMVDHTIDKCDFCLSRTAEGTTPEPACCVACVAGARVFGTQEDIEKLVTESDRDAIKLMEEEGTGPTVVYLPDVRY
ncbi:4Fe-4S dicluster domain-containing protein [Eggerthella sp. YY7918]|uniref:4Fe-4S dicluster domain-containing protein n=1 Tax=Eggerthella sp. (strain YY7918) TaxID=502558 RepID=UPI0002171457|nr:4Fe-4S dicluster domain-containing protein [Eggerthella sp. YY7918]BAK44867.1 Fe-S-cluster-containing hydrogenase component 1 [Eggerthella sp. YY7918]